MFIVMINLFFGMISYMFSVEPAFKASNIHDIANSSIYISFNVQKVILFLKMDLKKVKEQI